MLTLVSKGLEPSSFAEQIVKWFAERDIVSDGHLVWLLGGEPGSPLELFTHSSWSEVDRLLETHVYGFFNSHCVDPVTQLELNFYPTMKELPQCLARNNRLVQRHSSSIFKFKNALVSVYGKSNNFRQIDPGSRLWNLICTKPYFVRGVDMLWTPEEPPTKQLWNCALTKYLLACRNMPHSIILFYALLGRMLHRPRHYEQWDQSLGVLCVTGESMLVLMMKMLFDPRDVRTVTPFGSAVNDDDSRPVQLTLCRVEPQGGKRKPIVLPEPPRGSHYLVHGDLRNSRLSNATMLVHDQFTTYSASQLLLLLTSIPETLQLAQRVFWLTVSTVGTKPNSFVPDANLPALVRWLELWNISCPICSSQTLCPHVFGLSGD